MGVERGLDFYGGNVFAAADDDVLLAIDDIKVGVFVEIAQIARAEPAIGGERFARRCIVVPIADEVADRTDADLADRALR